MPLTGSSPNKVFTRTDGTRTGTQVWEEADAASIAILSSAHDVHDQDVGDTLSLVWYKDGSTQPTADLPMNGFKLTGVGLAIAGTQFARADQVQKSALFYGGKTTGSANSFVVALSPTITTYTDGMIILARSHLPNSGVGATLLNAGGGGKRVLVNGTNPTVGVIAANTVFQVNYNVATDVFDLVGGHNVDTALANTNAYIASVNLAKANTTMISNLVRKDVADQTITGGVVVTSFNWGVKTSGTVTIDMGKRPLQHLNANGAFTLSPGANSGACMLDLTLGTHANTITTSGWTKVAGTLSAKSGDKFRCHLSVGNLGSLLVVQAFQ